MRPQVRKARRARVEEALEQQTATAEILRVMSSSPADVQPVFEAVLSNALRLCEASFAAVFTFDGELVRNVAHLNASPQFARFLGSGGVRPSRETTTRRCALERRTIHTADLMNDPEFSPPEAQRREKVRTSLSVPMFRESTLVGVISLWRAEVKPFTERQIALVETFAAQAAIAIENVRLFNETKEALQQQTAISEILQVMSSSPTNVGPVLSAVAERAARLCEAEFVTVFMAEDGVLRAAGYSSAAASYPFPHGEDALPLDRSYIAGRAALTGQTVHLEDVVPLLGSEFPGARENQEKFGFRTFLAVPLLRDNRAIGVIAASRRVARRFSDKQVALVETFAAQAAIAIENVRLFNETREALEQQKSIAEVLGVVTQLQTDVQPVFEAIGRNAARLCGALFSCVYRFDGERIHLVATHNLPPAAMEVGRSLYPMRPDRSQLSGRAILTRSVQRLEDAAQDAEYATHVAVAGGWRRLLAVPMLREAEPLGVIAVGWRDPGPIPEPRVELLKTFSDQAVIAIEKVRLFNETREALEQQKAAGEVLRVISSSIADTAPVFDKILESCQRLFAGRIVGLNLVGEDGMLHIGAYHGAHRAEFERIFPIPVTRESGSGLSIVERRVVHYPDAQNGADVPERTRRGCTTIGIKSAIFAPLLWEGCGVGAIFVGRDHVSSFSEKEIALLRTFADQAAIAIENVRLFNETKQALERQTATAEILAVISRSPTDTKPVFDAIVQGGLRLFGDAAISVALPDGEQVRAAAVAESDSARAAAWRGRFPFPLTREYMHGVAILDRKVVDIPDVRDAPPGMAAGARNFLASGYRGITIMPMMRGGEAIGALSVVRVAPGPLTDRQLAVLKTFADQAVIAIENVRLFNEIREKSAQLEVASRHKSEFLANMSHELRTPLNAIIGFTRIVMRRSREALEPKQHENLERILTSSEQLLALINSILDLSKVEAGRVELHPGEVGLAPVLEQCVRTVEPLAKVSLVKEFAGDLPLMYVDEEKLRQIVINLLSNAVKFTQRGAIRVKAQAANGSVAIAVCDTGIGIPPDKLELIFQEFEQADASSTRVYGGTGLGLAIARRLARLMGGDITAESVFGSGSTFRLTLPVRYGPPA
jgi:signal transduction histidine kinase/putative methionine-R-sulfoxide reductase with GAF domain